MNKQKGSWRLLRCGIVLLLLVCLMPARGWWGRPAEAQDQPAGNPGTASDPVLTVSSLQQELNQLFAAQTTEMGQLQARLKLVAAGIQALQGAAPFPDLDGNWAASAVAALKTRGVISGYPDGDFHPNDGVTRASMAEMLMKEKNQNPSPGAAGFPDVPPGYWAAAAIGAARAAGYLQGYPDGSFRPEGGVSRAEAAVMLVKAFEPKGSGHASSFNDVGSNFWAAGAISQMAEAGIISGYPDGSFKPDRVMTRAEAAALLARFLPNS